MTDPHAAPADAVPFDFDSSRRWHTASDAATMESWPAPYAFIGGGSSFREGK
jgi:hypothetical protein